MYKKRVRQMTAALTRRLLTKPAASYLGLDRAGVTELLQRRSGGRFEALLSGEGRISCQRTIEVWEEVLSELSPVPEEGWLAYTYRFACDLVFPRAQFDRRRHGAGACSLCSRSSLTMSCAATPSIPCWMWAFSPRRSTPGRTMPPAMSASSAAAAGSSSMR